MTSPEGHEEWRAVVGHEGRYEVSSEGRVRSLRRMSTGRLQYPIPERILKLAPSSHGYLSVSLYFNGRSITTGVHKLVALAFYGPRPGPDFEVCHNNGDQLDNRLSNLRWGTRSSNVRDQIEHGVHPSASKTECAKGHLYTTENTYVYKNQRRDCRTCHRARQRIQGQKKRARLRILGAIGRAS